APAECAGGGGVGRHAGRRGATVGRPPAHIRRVGGLVCISLEDNRGVPVRRGRKPYRQTARRWREDRKIIDGIHTAIRSRMNGAAAARLGNDQTPGRSWLLGPTYTADAPTASARPMSSGRSPTTQGGARSGLSAVPAAFAMPGAGLRSSLARANASTTPSGWEGQYANRSSCAPYSASRSAM